MIHAIRTNLDSRPLPIDCHKDNPPSTARAAISSSNEYALSALGATSICTLQTHVVHKLRCHFITTTKLSKSLLPARSTHWRNHHFNSRLKVCQHPLRLSPKDFFPAAFGEESTRAKKRCRPRANRRNGVWIISALGRLTTHPKKIFFSPKKKRHNFLSRHRLQTSRFAKTFSDTPFFQQPTATFSRPAGGLIFHFPKKIFAQPHVRFHFHKRTP